MHRIAKNRSSLLAFLFIVFVSLCVAPSAGAGAGASPTGTSAARSGPAAQAATTTVFLVRHAEKVDPADPEFAGASPDDPPLSASGVARAEELARTLGRVGITTIYSSPYERTRATVRPLAARLGLEITEHPAADVAELAERIRAANRGGVVVIAGHSNTVPALIEALGAGSVPPIEDAWEYDNLYIVTVEAAGRARVSILKYGAASDPLESF